MLHEIAVGAWGFLLLVVSIATIVLVVNTIGFGARFLFENEIPEFWDGETGVAGIFFGGMLVIIALGAYEIGSAWLPSFLRVMP